jgi:YaiO family outer membrane protein
LTALAKATRVPALVSSLCLVALCAAPLAAQSPPARWEASAVYTYDAFRGSALEWGSWDSWTGSVLRRFSDGALGFEAGRVHRFGATDTRAAVDAYRGLWRGAYAHARADVAPSSEVIARTDLSVGLHQALDGGWEPAVAYRRMRFPDVTVHVGSAALGRSVGAWYGDVRLLRASLAEGGPSGHVVVGMLRYMGERGEWIDAAAAVGGEATMIAGPDGGALVTVRRTTTISTSARVALGELGLVSMGFAHSGFEGVPDRVTASVGFTVRSHVQNP